MLLLSANFGSGHLQAARAMACACQDLTPTAIVEAVNIDSPALHLATSGYLKLLQLAPGAYGSLYRRQVAGPVRAMIRAAYGPAVRHEIARLNPQVVVATHPFPGAAAAHLRATRRLAAKVALVITDFVPHPLWVNEGVDHYFVAAEVAAQRLVALGVQPGRITVTGIPIHCGFAQAEWTGRALEPGRHVLVMGGGLGFGPVAEAVRSFAELPFPDLKVTVVCGANRALRADLADLFAGDCRITVLGHTSAISWLMAQADLLVSKPGGLTCSEAMACGLPCLLLQPLPGHEEENAAQLTRTGAALVVDEESAGRVAADLLYREPALLAQMRAAATAAGRPRSALEIARALQSLATVVAQ